MADVSLLPGPRSWPNMPPEWFRFFRDLSTTEAPEAPVVDGFLPDTSNVGGILSVQTVGTLASGFVEVSLVGDVSSPGNGFYYGSGPTGAKGFHDVYGVAFEAVSKNLKSWNATLAYTGDTLDAITYTDGVDTVIKTFGYTVDQLTSLTLSGDTPAGIDLIKTLSYTGDQLTALAYT